MCDDAYTVDNNTIQWSGFFNTEEEAQESLENKLKVFALKKNIVTAKKVLQVRKADNNLVHKLKEIQRSTKVKGMLLYKFIVITSPKEKA